MRYLFILFIGMIHGACTNKTDINYRKLFKSSYYLHLDNVQDFEVLIRVFINFTVWLFSGPEYFDTISGILFF